MKNGGVFQACLPPMEPTRHVALFLLTAALLVFSPMILGGNRPLPILVIEVAGIFMLALALRTDRVRTVIPGPMSLALLVLVCSPFVQLVPVPMDVWEAMPGRSGYAVSVSDRGQEVGWRALSIIPLHTEYAAWAILPPVAMFVSTMLFSACQVRRLVWIFVILLLGQAILGLMQYGDGPGSWLRFGPGAAEASAVGTYPNRNLYAGLLVMGLPVVLALLSASIFGMERRTSQWRRTGWLSRLKSWGGHEAGTNRTALYAAMALAVLLGIVFSRSRSGIALSMIVILLSIFVLGRNFGGRFSLKLLSVITVIGLALAAVIGLAPVLARFGVDPMQDVRWAVFAATWIAVVEFFPLGSGAGTYPDVMAALQPNLIGGEYYVNHAHNDYLEWWVEGGGLAILLMGWFGVLYLARWRAVWAERNWRTMHMMQVGAGLGMLMVMFHSLVDFNLRIPANQICFAFLAGVFFHTGEKGSSSHRASQRVEQSSFALTEALRQGKDGSHDDLCAHSGVRTTDTGQLSAGEDQRRKNPFAD